MLYWKNMKIKLTILFLIFICLITTGFGCKGGDPAAKKALLKQVELKMWGIFDPSDAFSKIIAAYRIAHPNVRISYYKLRWEDYEKKLIEGWAEGEGPDIFVVHNTWLGKYQSKILPMPQRIKLPTLEQSGFLKKEKKAVIKEFPTLTPYQVKNIFPDVVYKDVVKNNLIYGLPLSVDTLSLFYNREHLNAAGLTQPPATWQELTEVTKKLTRQNEEGEIIRSAIALGGANNINRSNDILSLLMMQNGTQMVGPQGQIAFNRPSSHDRNFYPGEQALRFYTDFALPSKEVYTWNNNLPEALELFSAGKLSMMFGFAYQIPLIRAQAPKVDLGIAPVLHINKDGTDSLGLPVNLASYWCYTVFKRTKYPNEAWDFLNFMSTKKYKDEKGNIRYYVENYLNKTQKPPALKSLISKYKSQYPERAPFAEQILTAKSWYRGKNPNYANQIFKQMIENVIQGKSTPRNAINTAAQAISQTY